MQNFSVIHAFGRLSINVFYVFFYFPLTPFLLYSQRQWIRLPCASQEGRSRRRDATFGKMDAGTGGGLQLEQIRLCNGSSQNIHQWVITQFIFVSTAVRYQSIFHLLSSPFASFPHILGTAYTTLKKYFENTAQYFIERNYSAKKIYINGQWVLPKNRQLWEST